MLFRLLSGLRVRLVRTAAKVDGGWQFGMLANGAGEGLANFGKHGGGWQFWCREKAGNFGKLANVWWGGLEGGGGGLGLWCF